MESFSSCDILLLQNEINFDAAQEGIRIAMEKGMTIILNPAPCTRDILDPRILSRVSVLILNQIEARMVADMFQLSKGPTQAKEEEWMAQEMMNRMLHLSLIILTLGSKGGLFVARKTDTTLFTHHFDALDNVHAIDTTGAGDTFVGYFVGLLSQSSDRIPSNWTLDQIESLLMPVVDQSVTASGICCESVGAISSIPVLSVVVARAKQKE